MKEENKNAIDVVRQMIADGQISQEVAEKYFPELKESEDERIRKEIIDFIYDKTDTYELREKSNSWLAWLEKRGEKKSIDDLTPQEAMDIAVAKCFEQGEQKPADDVYEGLTDFERTLADICVGWIGMELGWKPYIKDNADVLLKIAFEMWNSVQDIPFEQKPWGEEDEKYWSIVIAEFSKCAGKSVSKDEWMRCNDWLNSLRNKVQSQSKQEWGEEDAVMLNDCICAINAANEVDYSISEKERLTNFLNSLRPQKHWKPSEEQIDTLKEAMYQVGILTPLGMKIYDLCEQLKKLKEE